MSVAIYSRKSKFTGKGESIENQIQLCMEYAKNIGKTDFLIYEDEGFSGKNTHRPEFQKMINDAKMQKFDTLICYRLDRISRNIADFSILIKQLQDIGISFISIREQFDTSTPMGRAMMYIASVFAQLERETISERIRDNMHELAKSGRWLGGQTPLGYDSKEIIYIDDSFKEKSMYQLIPNQSELKTVQLIFEQYLHLKSLSKVNEYMLEHNIKGKNGGNLSKGSINDILKNPVYVKTSDDVLKYFSSIGINVLGKPDNKSGILTYSKHQNSKSSDVSKWIVSISSHQGIIDDKDWILAQNILYKNKHLPPRISSSHRAFLTGTLKCICGSSMRVTYGKTRKDGTKPHYYVCSLKHNSKNIKCNGINLNGEKIEKFILDEVANIDKDILINTFKCELKSIRDPLNNINKKILDCKNAISNLIKQLSKNINSSACDYIISEIETLNKQIKKYEQEKASCSNFQTNFFKLHTNSANILEQFQSDIITSSVEDKRLLISTLIKNIIWDYEHEEIKIIYYA